MGGFAALGASLARYTGIIPSFTESHFTDCALVGWFGGSVALTQECRSGDFGPIGCGAGAAALEESRKVSVGRKGRCRPT